MSDHQFAIEMLKTKIKNKDIHALRTMLFVAVADDKRILTLAEFVHDLSVKVRQEQLSVN
jgi:hypothetical protein